MKIKTTVKFSSLYSGIMLFLLYHIVFVKFPYVPLFVLIQRIFTLVLGIMVFPKINFINLKKPIKLLLGTYLLFTFISAFLNEGNYEYSHPFVSGLFYILAVTEMVCVFSYVVRKKGIHFVIDVLFVLSFCYVIVNDFLVVFFPNCFYRYGWYYFVGNKFSVSYKHIEFIVLYFIKCRHDKKFLPFIIMVISLLITLRVNCMTGAVGIVFFGILLFADTGKIIENKIFLFILMLFSLSFPFIYDFIMGGYEVRYFIIYILNRTAGLTGRTEIFDYLPQILRGHLLFGYGHNTAYEVWISITDWYPNAQNGFWNCVCEQGIISAILLSVITVMTAGRCTGKTEKILLAVIYVYTFLGSVEITMDIAFITWVIFLYIVKGEKYGISSCQRDSTVL